MTGLDPDVVRSALERALGTLGLEESSRRLRAPPELVQAWVNGHATLPEHKVRTLLDLLDDISC